MVFGSDVLGRIFQFQISCGNTQLSAIGCILYLLDVTFLVLHESGVSGVDVKSSCQSYVGHAESAQSKTNSVVRLPFSSLPLKT